MKEMDRLVEIMARLRDPEAGCPWDLAQTFETIVPHTLEEAYEVAEAIEAGDFDHLREELGDLLFQVLFYARLAEEQGRWDLGDVARTLAGKLVRRHPHVFAGRAVGDAAEQTRQWEAHKAAERAARGGGPAGALDGVSRALPALSRAQKLQRRAARVGFDWNGPEGVVAKLEEELDELKGALARDDAAGAAAELGDLMFTAVNLARHLELDAEQVLRAANRRFEDRFRRMEERLGGPGAAAAATPGEREAAWAAAKAEEGPE